MDNLEYLEYMKREESCWLSNHKNKLRDCYKYRKIKALEIIAEELCIMNNPKYEVTIVKPKIQLNKKSLGYINKTSATKIKRI